MGVNVEVVSGLKMPLAELLCNIVVDTQLPPVETSSVNKTMHV